MKLEYRIRVLAGSLILASLLLSLFTASPWWLLLAAFVSVNLVQSAFTGFCPACQIFQRFFPDSPGTCGCSEKSCDCKDTPPPADPNGPAPRT